MPVCGLRSGNALDLAQHAVTAVNQGAHEQLLLDIDRNIVGPLSRAEHGNDDKQYRSIATATMTPIGTTTFVRMWLRPMLRGSAGAGGVRAKYSLPEIAGPAK
jgi:hypothetical protein